MSQCLIIGYGRMGKIHARHLDELGIPWDYHDPFVSGGVPISPNYSHVIISTPIGTHFDVYESLKGFDASILIEKPVVVHQEHLHIFEDERVFSGMVERFNPVSQVLLSRPITSLHFSRNASDPPPICDIAIHDIDLAFFALGERDWSVESVTGDRIEGHIGNVPVSFSFRKTPKKKRKCVINGDEVIDFYLQSHNGERLPFVWPVRKELECFLADRATWPDQQLARCSHEFMIHCLARSAK